MLTPLPHPVCFWPSALTPCMTRASGSVWPSRAGPRAGPSPLHSASVRRRRRGSSRRAARASPLGISGPWAQLRLGSPEPSPRPPRRPACARPGWARCDVHRRSAVATPVFTVFTEKCFPPVFTRIFSRKIFLEKIPVNFSSRFLTSSFEFSKLFRGTFLSTVPKNSDFRRLKA